jgi:hypothetical protein
MKSDCIFCIIGSEHADIVSRYWMRSRLDEWYESVSELSAAFDLDIETLVRLVESSSQAAICSTRCNVCRLPVLVANRAQYEQWQNVDLGGLPYTCGRCRRGEQFVDYPEFLRGLEDRFAGVEAELERRRDERIEFDIGRLQPVDAFYFYCLLLEDVEEGSEWELRPAATKKNFAPTISLLRQVYSRLWDIGAIEVSVRSPLSAFEIHPSQVGRTTVDLLAVAWFVPFDANLTRSCVRAQLLRRTRMLTPGEVKTIWYQLAESECLAHLLAVSKSLGKPIAHELADTLNILIRDCLKRASIYECKRLIDRALGVAASSLQPRDAASDEVLNASTMMATLKSLGKLPNGDLSHLTGRDFERRCR